MSYKKQNFKAGQALTAASLNAMDAQIAENAEELDSYAVLEHNLSDLSIKLSSINDKVDILEKNATALTITNSDTGKVYQGVLKVTNGKPVFEYDEVGG